MSLCHKNGKGSFFYDRERGNTMDWYPLKGDGHGLWGRPFFDSARLNAQLASAKDALWSAEGGVRRVALPYVQDMPFPLVELFCLAKIESVCGKVCAVYCADAQGRPLMPRK